MTPNRFRMTSTAVAPAIWGTTYLVTTQWLPAGRPLTRRYSAPCRPDCCYSPPAGGCPSAAGGGAARSSARSTSALSSPCCSSPPTDCRAAWQRPSPPPSRCSSPSSPRGCSPSGCRDGCCSPPAPAWPASRCWCCAPGPASRRLAAARVIVLHVGGDLRVVILQTTATGAQFSDCQHGAARPRAKGRAPRSAAETPAISPQIPAMSEGVKHAPGDLRFPANPSFRMKGLAPLVMKGSGVRVPASALIENFTRGVGCPRRESWSTRAARRPV